MVHISRELNQIPFFLSEEGFVRTFFVVSSCPPDSDLKHIVLLHQSNFLPTLFILIKLICLIFANITITFLCACFWYIWRRGMLRARVTIFSASWAFFHDIQSRNVVAIKDFLEVQFLETRMNPVCPMVHEISSHTSVFCGSQCLTRPPFILQFLKVCESFILGLTFLIKVGIFQVKISKVVADEPINQSKLVLMLNLVVDQMDMDWVRGKEVSVDEVPIFS